MQIDLVMPQMGESVAEGTVTKWYVKAGDAVEKDQTVLSISTDKVDAEIPAPGAGVLSEILVREGEKVNIGTVLARISAGGSATVPQPATAAPPPAAPAPPSPPAPAPAPAPAPSAARPPAASPRAAAPPPAAAQPPSPAPDGERSSFYSPLVMNIARVENVTAAELAGLRGSGAGGRVQKKDILAYVESRKASGGARAAAAPSSTPAAPAAALAPTPAPTPSGGAGDMDVVAMDSMRRAIAEHMVRSVQTSPHVTSIHEVDMTKVARLRDRVKDRFKSREGFGLTFMPFFISAAARALRAFPNVNASIEGTNVLQKRRVNIGIAVALDGGGLIVPVLKGADTMNLVGIARAANDLIVRARSRKLTPDDVSGGTFTITNLGSAGSLTGTPIINQPQVAIMGTGAIKKRPVVVDDMIGIREMMFLSMAYDHRIVDGMLAGLFLSAVTKDLETMDPEELA